MGQIVNREVVLASRPDGMPTPGNFEIRQSVMPELGSNELLIRNKFMSVDPYMRGRMRAGKSYAAPFQEGESMYGGAVGTVVASNNTNWKEGDEVVNSSGWREYTVSTGMGITRVDTSIAPLQSFLGIAGMPGQTAYFGLLRVGEPKPGETVFVSRRPARWAGWCARSPSSMAAVLSAASGRRPRPSGCGTRPGLTKPSSGGIPTT